MKYGTGLTIRMGGLVITLLSFKLVVAPFHLIALIFLQAPKVHIYTYQSYYRHHNIKIIYESLTSPTFITFVECDNNLKSANEYLQ